MSEHDVCESDSYVYERIPRDRVSRSQAFLGTVCQTELCGRRGGVPGGW